MYSLFFLLLVGLFFVLIPIIIGTYVYKDAKSRKMDAILWTLVAVLVPSFIGLIIYLVIRGNNPNISCCSCSNPIASDYVLCPYCGTALKATCPSCAAPVDSGWKLCPKCGTALPEQKEPVFATAPPKKDRKLLWILIVAIAVPVLLLVFGILGLISFNSQNINLTSAGFGIELENDTFVPPRIVRWVDECDVKGKGVYVLRIPPEEMNVLDSFTYESGEVPKDIYCIYIYMNQYKGTGIEKRLTGDTSFENKTIKVFYETSDMSNEEVPDYELSSITASGYKIKNLRIFVDGTEVPYSIE